METKKKSFFLGYSMIGNGFISYMFMNLMTTSSVNVIINALCQEHGWENANLLYWTTIGGLVAAVVSYFLGKLMVKVGLKVVYVTSLIIAGIVFACIGLSTSSVVFGILMLINYCATYAYNSMATPALMGNWFPRKRGAIMGIVTAGGAVATLVLLPLFNKSVTAIGLTKAMLIWGGILAVYGLINAFWVKNKPSEAGLFPDNIETTQEEEARLYAKKEEKTVWTFRRIVTNPRLLCLIFAWGFILMALYGFGVQSMSFFMFKGMDQAAAVRVLSFSGIVGIVGSIVSGFVDQKTSPRIASIVFLAIMAVGFAVMTLFSSLSFAIVGYYIVQFIGGAPNNLMTTTISQKVSNKHFMDVFSVCMPAYNLIRMLGPSIMAVGLTAFGNYNAAVGVLGALVVVAVILIILSGERMEVAKEE